MVIEITPESITVIAPRGPREPPADRDPHLKAKGRQD